MTKRARAPRKAPDLRETGISVLGRMPWSTHISLFYDTRDDLLDALVPSFKAGLTSGELCVWLWSVPALKRAFEAGLRASLPAFDKHLERGNLRFIDGRQWLRAGHFDREGLIRTWASLSECARNEGYAGLRAAGDHTWLRQQDWSEFSRFEETMDAFVVNRPILFVCTYPLRELRATDILDSARAHHLAIARRRGQWDVLETPRLKATKEQIQRRNEELERSIAERTRQLARSETYLEEGQRLSRSGSFAIDMATGECTYASPENRRIFGYDPEGPLPRRDDVMKRIHPGDRARVKRFGEAAAGTLHDLELEFRLLLPGRKVRHIHAVTHPVVDETGRIVEIVGSSIDITDRKRAAATLARAKRTAHERAVEARYEAAFEERTRLAREIHDSLLQGVTGIALQLRATLPRLEGAPATAADSIRMVAELAESTSRDARRAVWDMRAPSLTEKGLAAALAEALPRTAGKVALDFGIEGKPRPLPFEVEEAIFRVAQESTLNAVKHAAATKISVTLTYKPRTVALSVTDDGCGFRAERRADADSGRWGLLGMRERAQQIGGSLTIRRAPGGGTIVSLRVTAVSRRGVRAD